MELNHLSTLTKIKRDYSSIGERKSKSEKKKKSKRVESQKQKKKVKV